jgi:hypothetical protein
MLELMEASGKKGVGETSSQVQTFKILKQVSHDIILLICGLSDRLCGLVVSVPDYRSRSGFDSRRYQIV